MSLMLQAPPSAEPITLSELKDHLRISDTDEDALITGMLVAAVRAIEARGGLALMTQQWRLTLDHLPEETVLLPITPVRVVNNVAIIDQDGIAQTVDPNLYEVAVGTPGRLRRAGPWLVPGVALDGVQIDFTVGYGDAALVPAPLKQAVKLLAAHFYEAREAASDARIFAMPQSVDALIAPFREVRL